MAWKWDSDRPRDFAYLMLVTVTLTTIGWVAVTLLTRPEPEATLRAFYKRVHPTATSDFRLQTSDFRRELVNALLGCVLVYAALFGVGEILLRSVTVGLALLVVSAAAAFAIARNLREPAAKPHPVTS
jgi:hypothetical protein